MIFDNAMTNTLLLIGFI